MVITTNDIHFIKGREDDTLQDYRTNKIDGQWQADLVKMIEFHNVNDGYRYLLTVVDLFPTMHGHDQ